MAKADGVVEQAWKTGSYRMEVWMTGAAAQSLLFLHDKNLLVSGETDGTVRVLYEKTRGPTTVEKVHAGGVTALVSVATSALKNLFVSAGMDRVIRLWGPNPVSDGHFRVLQELRITPGDEQGCDTEHGDSERLPTVGRSGLAPAAASTGDALFLISGGRRIVLWGPPEDGDAEDRVAVLDVVQLKSGPALIKLCDLRGHAGGVKYVTSGDDDEVVTVDVLDTVRVFSARSRTVEATLPAVHDESMVSCVLSVREHAQRMATPLLLLGREDGTIDVRAWPSAGGARLHSLRRHSGRVTHMIAVGEVLLSAGEDIELPGGGQECVRFMNVGTGKLHGSFTTAPVTCACVRTDSCRSAGMQPLLDSALAVTGHVDAKVILWDVAAQRSLHILDGHHDHKAVTAVFANRFCVVSGARDTTCRVWRFVDSFVLGKEEEERARAARRARDKAEAARKTYQRRLFTEAVALYTAAIELDPSDLLLVTNRAAVLLEAGDFVACIADCNKALDAVALKQHQLNGLDACTPAHAALHEVSQVPQAAASAPRLVQVPGVGGGVGGGGGGGASDGVEGRAGAGETAEPGAGEACVGDQKVLARAHGRKGAALAGLGQEEEAILHLRASLAADPTQEGVRERLQRILQQQGLRGRDETASGRAEAETEGQGYDGGQAAYGDQSARSGAETRGSGCDGPVLKGCGPMAFGCPALAEVHRAASAWLGAQGQGGDCEEEGETQGGSNVRTEVQAPALGIGWGGPKGPGCGGGDDVEEVGRAGAVEGGREDEDEEQKGGEATVVLGKLAPPVVAGVEQREVAVGAEGESERAGVGAVGKGQEGEVGGDWGEGKGGRGEVRAAVEKDKERGNEMFKARRYGDAIGYYNKALEVESKARGVGPGEGAGGGGDAAHHVAELSLAPTLLLNRALAHSEMGAYTLAASDFDRALVCAREALTEAKSRARIMETDTNAEAKAAAAVTAAADQVMKVLTKKGRMLEKKALKGPRAGRPRVLKEALKCLEDGAGSQPPEASEAQREVLQMAAAAVRDKLRVLAQDDVAKEECANGDRMFQDGQYEAAVGFYDKAEAADPQGERSDAYLMFSNRAGCLLELKRLPQAMRDAERAVKLKPSWISAHMLKARVHEALEQWPDMLASCCAAYDLDPSNQTNLAMLRDSLVSNLTDGAVNRRGGAPGAFAEALGRAREDADLRSMMLDPQVVHITKEMQRTRDLSPLVCALEDLPLAGKLAKLFHAGLLVPG